MRLRVFFFAGALVLLTVQMVLGRALQVGGAAPDFYLLFVVYLVGILPPGRALGAAWLLGLTRDCFTPAPLGMDALALVTAAGLLVWLHRRFVLDTDVALGLLAFLAGLVHGAVWASALHLGGAEGARFALLFTHIGLPVALYTALLMPLFARLANVVVRRLAGAQHVRLT